MIRHDDLRLLAGLPIEIDKVGYIYPLKIIDVAKLTESVYNTYLSALTIDVADIIADIDDKNVNIDDLETFEIIISLCLQDESFKETVLSALRLFFNEEKVQFIDEMGIFFLGEIEEQRVIHRNNYEEIKHTLLLQNFISPPEKLNFANERAKKLYMSIQRNKRKYARNTDNGSRIFNIISSIAWKKNIGMSVWDLTVFQLFDAFHRSHVVDKYGYTMQGIYAGTIDGQKIKFNEIDWSQNINVLRRK